MVFDKIAEVIYSATNRSSMRHSSSIPYIAAGLSPSKGHGLGFSFGSPGHMNNLRLSSSLQDFSQYRQLDPEDSDLSGGNDALHSRSRLPYQKDTPNSSFSKDKIPPITPFLRRKWARVLICFICLLLFCFFAFFLGRFLYSLWSGGASNFYVVLDSGSTGTRIYIYEASIAHKKDNNLPIILRSYSGGYRKPKGQSGRAYNRMETEPGLDKLVRNSTALKGAIKPLLRWAEKQIPKGSHKTTSLFLYATAGVRRLPAKDSEWLLNHAWSVMKNSPFVCEREWVKIISGMEEAYYGWIALNYETDVLGAFPKKATFGALDLGGSSLQVTFESKEPAYNKTNLNLSIGPVNHHLSAYSLSGYGLNDAFDKSVVRLLKGMPKVSKEDLAHGNVEIKHPCLHTGYKSQYFCSQCASMNEEAQTPYNAEKGMKKGGKPGVPVWLIGSPNWTECSSLAKIAVNLSEWSNLSPGIDCDVQPCALSEDLPHPDGHFYAMSGFFVVYRFFNLSSEATLDDVLEKGHQFCDKTWDVAYKSVSPQPFIEQYCFRAPYIVQLLREGLHITESQVTIGSGGTTWTQGVALVEAGNGFATRKDLRTFELFQVKIDPVILFAILLISLFLLVCALSCVGNWLPKYFRRSYLPVYRNSGTSTALNIPSPFRFQRWSPKSSDSRVKMPLSPTIINNQERPFGQGPWLGGSNIQLTDSSLYPTASSVSHSFSSTSLGQLPFDNNGMGSGWSPLRSQMGLQSRRSQSREDLISSLADAHTAKV